MVARAAEVQAAEARAAAAAEGSRHLAVARLLPQGVETREVGRPQGEAERAPETRGCGVAAAQVAGRPEVGSTAMAGRLGAVGRPRARAMVIQGRETQGSVVRKVMRPGKTGWETG